MSFTRRRFATLAGAAAAAAVLPRRATWAAPGGPRESLRVVFYTDVHTRVEWETPRALEMAAGAINACAADLVIAGGDLITEGFQTSSAEVLEPRWQAYLVMHGAIRPRVEPVIGNHDLVAALPSDGGEPAADPRAAFRRHLGVKQTYRSFDAGGYRFLLLDAVDIVGGGLSYEGRVSDEQLAWLGGVLEQTPAGTPLVLASHLPLLTGFYQATEGATAAAPRNRAVVNSLDVLELLAGHDLRLVLQGHLHVEETLRWQQTRFITGGALCGKWWRGSWHGTGPGFGVVTLGRDRIDWEYRDYGWTPRRP